MAKIFVTRQLPGQALEALAQEHDVQIFPEPRPITEKELYEGIKDAEVLISLLTDRIDSKAIQAGPNLKIIANYAVGYNNIDVDWATAFDIAVLNTPGVLTDASADLAFGLLLAAARRIPEGDRFIRKGQWKGWDPSLLLGPHVSGKTLGILGMGRIGQAVAKRAIGFGMKLLYSNQRQLPAGIERELGAEFVTVNDLLTQSDFVSLHCPLTPETKHLINRKSLAQMKPGAILINTARGAVVDEDALVETLQSGHLFAAGLDVYEDEPNVHPGLLAHPQVVLAPHLGSATQETRNEMASLLVRGIQALFKNKVPNNLINPEIIK